MLWQGACSAFLAFGAWARAIDPGAVLGCIFALGIGLAFGAPVLGAIVPDIVDKEKLPSAITLGGVQLNLSGIVGPALGGLLLPVLGAPFPHLGKCADVSRRRLCRSPVEAATNPFGWFARKLP